MDLKQQTQTSPQTGTHDVDLRWPLILETLNEEIAKVLIPGNVPWSWHSARCACLSSVADGHS